MTCNQLMTLLACYRGTLEGEMQTGTYHDDVRVLRDRGLLDDNLHCTGKGIGLVDKTLEELDGT